MKMISLLLLISVLHILVSCTSRSQHEVCTQIFQFEVSLNISPSLDTFKVRDTIWLESTISNQVEDIKTGSLVDIADFDYKTKVGLYKFDGDMFIFAEDFFEYVNQIGEFQRTSITNVNVVYAKNLNNKTLKIGLVPLYEGLFFISFYNLTDDVYNVSLTDSDCYQVIDVGYNMNDGDNNFSLIAESVHPSSTEEAALKSGVYAFWIIE